MLPTYSVRETQIDIPTENDSNALRSREILFKFPNRTRIYIFFKRTKFFTLYIFFSMLLLLHILYIIEIYWSLIAGRADRHVSDIIAPFCVGIRNPNKIKLFY